MRRGSPVQRVRFHKRQNEHAMKLSTAACKQNARMPHVNEPQSKRQLTYACHVAVGRRTRRVVSVTTPALSAAHHTYKDAPQTRNEQHDFTILSCRQRGPRAAVDIVAYTAFTSEPYCRPAYL